VITVEGVITLLKRAALLGIFALLAVMMWAGPASAAENGLIYYSKNGILSVEPTPNNSQINLVSHQGSEFDISRDTLVYNTCSWFGCYAALYTLPLTYDDPYYDGTPVEITNLSSSATEIKSPKFSPDSKTIYFAGKHVLESDDDTYRIYSVPTIGGEATKIPIDIDDTVTLSTFDLSHDGSKFAMGGKGGIVTVPVSGGAPTRITNDSCKGASYPDFSPDDQTIIYNLPVYADDTCEGSSVLSTLYTTPVSNDGTQPGEAVFPEDLQPPYPTYAAHRSKWYGTYSPDGKSITFSNWRDDTYKLATAPATGGTVTTITGCTFCKPVWAEKPPETTLTSQPPTVTNETTASFSFSSNDAAATFECRLDYYYGWEEGDGFESCTSPKDYPDVTYHYPDAPEWDTAEGWHTFEVRAIGSGGAADLTPASYGWEVDTTVPTVGGSVSPADAAGDVALTANAEATFSEAIDQNTLTSSASSAFTLTKNGSTTPVQAKVSYDSASNKATLDPTSDLEANTTYTATIKSGSNGVKDRAGNALAQDYSWTFTTTAPPPDTTKPTVASLLATDLNGNVPLRKTSFKASFSEKMDTKTLNTTTFKLFKCSSTTSTTCTTQIAATEAPVTPSTDGLSATLNPYGTTLTLLAKNTRYKVVVTTGARDLAGNALAQEKSSYFNIGSS
jgi:hypothetical protein